MDLTDEQYTRLLRYVDGEMTEKEAAFFELLLTRDEKLREELAVCRELKEICASAMQKLEKRIEAESDEDSTAPGVSNLISDARREWKEKNANVDAKARERFRLVKTRKGFFGMSRTFWFAAAATCTVVLAAVFFFQQKKVVQPLAKNQTTTEAPPVGVQKIQLPSSASNPKDSFSTKEDAPQLSTAGMHRLFAAYFKLDDAPTTTNKLLSEPVVFYKAKKFGRAIEGFEMAERTLSLRSTNSPETRTRFSIYFYLAQSRLAAGTQLEQSMVDLKRAAKEAKDESSKRKVRWYLGLACLRKGDAKEAKNYLLPLSATNNNYTQRASEILQQLNAD